MNCDVTPTTTVFFLLGSVAKIFSLFILCVFVRRDEGLGWVPSSLNLGCFLKMGVGLGYRALFWGASPLEIFWIRPWCPPSLPENVPPPMFTAKCILR